MTKPPNVNPGHDAAVRRMLAVPPQPSRPQAAKPKDRAQHSNNRKSRRNGRGK